MLSKRIIGAVLVKDDSVIQSLQFKNYLPVGKPAITVEYFSRWGADEILLIDISRTKRGLEPNYELIENCSTYSTVPIAYGGGVSSLDIARRVFLSGADKVVMNSRASASLFKDISEQYGSQSVVLSIDVHKTENIYKLFNYLSGSCSEQTLEDYIEVASSWGIGEILLQSVDFDGVGSGFDLELISSVSSKSIVPVIALGGAGKSEHFRELFNETLAEAGAAANYFHFTEHSITVLKYLLGTDQYIRNDTTLSYPSHTFDDFDRIKKIGDELLDQMYYQKIIEERI